MIKLQVQGNMASVNNYASLCLCASCFFLYWGKFILFIWPKCGKNHWPIEEKDESKLVKSFSLRNRRHVWNIKP